jgi:hypothetical protein
VEEPLALADAVEVTSRETDVVLVMVAARIAFARGCRAL